MPTGQASEFLLGFDIGPIKVNRYMQALGITDHDECVRVQLVLRHVTDPILRKYLAQGGPPIHFLNVCRVEVQRAFIGIAPWLPVTVINAARTQRQLTIALYGFLHYLRLSDSSWLKPLELIDLGPGLFEFDPAKLTPLLPMFPAPPPVPVPVPVRTFSSKCLPGSSLTIPAPKYPRPDSAGALCHKRLPIPAHLLPGSAQQAIAFDIVGPPPPNSPAGFVAQTTAETGKGCLPTVQPLNRYSHVPAPPAPVDDFDVVEPRSKRSSSDDSDYVYEENDDDDQTFVPSPKKRRNGAGEFEI